MILIHAVNFLVSLNILQYELGACTPQIYAIYAASC